ncbi:MAG: prepilin-type N-terminal cleavage/methylation domain-containing protein, partial [Phycisphaeraceae bacterium]|nr:prepilin-type N-terminal cleavage/methylation domain-containing protein [Phycisphaeraceae bacterium]
MIRRHRAGFSLVEMLLAVAIFGIGMAGVATIFPAAALMQKRTMHAITSDRIGSSAEAYLRMNPFVEADLVTEIDALETAYDTNSEFYGAPSELAARYSLLDRGYPSTFIAFHDDN